MIELNENMPEAEAEALGEELRRVDGILKRFFGDEVPFHKLEELVDVLYKEGALAAAIPLEYRIRLDHGNDCSTILPEAFTSLYAAQVYACGGFDPPRKPLPGRVIVEYRKSTWRAVE